MGIGGPGIEPASGGATAQKQPLLRYQSPVHCEYVPASMCYVSDTQVSTRLQLQLLSANAADDSIPHYHLLTSGRSGTFLILRMLVEHSREKRLSNYIIEQLIFLKYLSSGHFLFLNQRRLPLI